MEKFRHLQKTKWKTFSSNIQAVLLYGAETQKSNIVIRRKLQTFINRCLRNILNIHWPEKIRTEELLELAGEEPVQTQIKRRQWRCISHTLRKSDDSIDKQAIDWNPQGAYKRGRLKTTRKRAVCDEIGHHGKTWGEVKALSSNRVRWKTFTEALCSSTEWQDISKWVIPDSPKLFAQVHNYRW
jgi:hypothetical protein